MVKCVKCGADVYYVEGNPMCQTSETYVFLCDKTEEQTNKYNNWKQSWRIKNYE